jgi:hypothetical protein
MLSPVKWPRKPETREADTKVFSRHGEFMGYLDWTERAKHEALCEGQRPINEREADMDGTI